MKKQIKIIKQRKKTIDKKIINDIISSLHRKESTKMSKKRFILVIDDDIYERVRVLAFAEKVSCAEIVRKAIKLLLNNGK